MVNRFEKYLTPKPETPADPLPAWLRTVDDAMRAAASGMTLGYFDKALQSTGVEPEAVAKTQAARQRSPVVTTVGEIAGSAVPASRMAKAISVVPGLAGKTIPSLIGREAATGAALSEARQFLEKGEASPPTTTSGAMAGVPPGLLGVGSTIAGAVLPGRLGTIAGRHGPAIAEKVAPFTTGAVSVLSPSFSPETRTSKKKKKEDELSRFLKYLPSGGNP